MVLPSVAAVYVGLMIAAIDSTLVVSLIGPISSSFGASDRAFWISTSYMLSLGACSPIYGRLSDIFGRKSCLLWATIIFGLGTGLCTMSPTMEFLILGRAVQGIGAAGLQPASAIVTNDLIPLRRRGMYHAFGQLVYSFGFAIGGPVGGFLNDWLGWRAAFTMQIPPILLAFFMILFFLKLPNLPITREQHAKEVEMKGKPLYTVIWTRCDPLGTTVMVAAVVTMLLTFSLVSVYDLAWSDVKVWGLLLIAAVLFAFFVLIEARWTREPIMPMRFMTQWSYTSIFLSYFIISTTQAMLFYLPFYLIVVMEESTSEIGLRFLPISVATLSSAFTVGSLLRRTGQYRTMAIVMTILSALSPAWMATWTAKNRPSDASQFLAVVPAGIGGSGLNTILMVALFAVAGQQDSAGAVGLVYLIRTSGVIVGISALGSIIQKILIVELNKRIHGKHADQIINLIRKNLNAIATLPSKQRQAAKESYGIALQSFQIIIVGLSLLNLVIVFFIKERPLSGRMEPQRPTNDEEQEAQS
ncbi:MFS general substrate transporter [Meira miltonrushii]|uniref:MFS general substrate transporter n=1 Tax=Meira miltonrushii TaxID=1280837 RepID=A0A316V2X6_9BASI|nr:MFS general substrate transporter [Meira miltonrushii]PWN31812.1 MFS general substrate transporter [Meira miltonrushii]